MMSLLLLLDRNSREQYKRYLTMKQLWLSKQNIYWSFIYLRTYEKLTIIVSDNYSS